MLKEVFCFFIKNNFMVSTELAVSALQLIEKDEF